ncbi:DUF2514 family protein, partial [Burkholderia cepacia]|uniref:DUF2514 family protein n=1 Tax=Burkholderia cepacia TaxID=292 RepID=UPI002FE1F1B3
TALPGTIQHWSLNLNPASHTEFRIPPGSLQQRVDQLVAAARHPAATTGGSAAGDALDLLANVLGRADQRAGDLAEYADRARIAGQQCERDYDALTAVAR